MTASQGDHVLYHHYYSICSMMVRYTFARRGKPKDEQQAISVKEKDIDIGHEEQLTEHFLCDVNLKGEVPVLFRPGEKPMPESLDITYYWAQSYPSLLPASHEDEIKQLLKEIHNISFFALTFTGKPQLAESERTFLLDRLAEKPTERYRIAIEQKLKRIDERMFKQLTEVGVQTNIHNAKAVLDKLAAILSDSSTDWCFSLPEPSALDTHLIVFIARLIDVKREELVPSVLRRYARKAIAGEEWQNIMEGRKTLPDFML